MGQVIDVADLARWLAHAGTGGVVGAYDLTGVPCPLTEVVDNTVGEQIEDHARRIKL